MQYILFNLIAMGSFPTRACIAYNTQEHTYSHAVSSSINRNVHPGIVGYVYDMNLNECPGP
jgi:hypothetical protein